MPQPILPCIYRPTGTERLRVSLPFDLRNRSWIHSVIGDRARPTYSKQNRYWLIARDHFSKLVEALLDRYGRVDVLAEFTTTEVCDTRCQNARGTDCQCTCLGNNHGGGQWGGWFQIGDTTLISHDRQLRHMRLTR